MTIIALDVRGKVYAEPHDVLLGGERVERCAAAFALWNGGPGYVVYYPQNVSGHVYLTPEGRIASAVRFGRVRVEKKPRQHRPADVRVAEGTVRL